jgi:hypothetical protein
VGTCVQAPLSERLAYHGVKVLPSPCILVAGSRPANVNTIIISGAHDALVHYHLGVDDFTDEYGVIARLNTGNNFAFEPGDAIPEDRRASSSSRPFDLLELCHGIGDL